jgi:hypothetical protein
MALPLSPITPRAPVTGGVWLIIKLMPAAKTQHPGFPRQGPVVGDYRHEINLVSIEMDNMLEKYHIICNN